MDSRRIDCDLDSRRYGGRYASQLVDLIVGDSAGVVNDLNEHLCLRVLLCVFRRKDLSGGQLACKFNIENRFKALSLCRVC